MNNQLQPLNEEQNIIVKPNIINLPEAKKEVQTSIPETKEIAITELPSWSIEPPIEVKRGN